VTVFIGSLYQWQPSVCKFGHIRNRLKSGPCQKNANANKVPWELPWKSAGFGELPGGKIKLITFDIFD
jgi:hypothetical protein